MEKEVFGSGLTSPRNFRVKIFPLISVKIPVLLHLRPKSRDRVLQFPILSTDFIPASPLVMYRRYPLSYPICVLSVKLIEGS